MKLTELNFDSVSNFSDEIAAALHDKAIQAIDAIRQEMSGVEVSDEIDEDDSDEDGVEFTFDPADLKEIIKIADSVGIEYKVDDSDEIEVTEEDPDKIEAFLDALDDAGIDYDSEETEDDVDESVAPKRVHTSALDKLQHKKAYRKNKSKIKIKANRYRKTAHAKRLKKVSKRKAKQGKTATGRRIIKRI